MKERLLERNRNVYADMAKVELITSSMIGTLLFFENQLKRNGFHIYVRNAGPKLRDLFTRSALDFMLR